MEAETSGIYRCHKHEPLLFSTLETYKNVWHASHGCTLYMGFPVVKNPPANVRDIRDVGLIPGSGRSPGGGNGNPLQHSCLEKSHKQRSLVGYSPQDHREMDMSE